MPQLTPYFLNFISGLHLGTRGINLEESATQIPSDTIFSAFVDSWRNAGQNISALLAKFTASPLAPPFLLTSAYPFVGGVRFYPAPLNSTQCFSWATLQERGKAIKRLRYWSEGILRHALAGEVLDEWLFPQDPFATPVRGLALQGGALWMGVDEVQNLPEALRLAEENSRHARPLHALRQITVFALDRTPRVTVDRIRSASAIFHVGRTTFAAGCGLWFGVQWRSPEIFAGQSDRTWHALFAETLAQLEGNGIGGMRSSGYGAFHSAQGTPFELPEPQQGKPALLLSRYHPTKVELPGVLASPAAYTLVPVAGWLRSPDAVAQRRKRLMLVGEGSIVCLPAAVAGDLVDIGPTYAGTPGVSHPVYRYGLALSVDASKWQERVCG